VSVYSSSGSPIAKSSTFFFWFDDGIKPDGTLILGGLSPALVRTTVRKISLVIGILAYSFCDESPCLVVCTADDDDGGGGDGGGASVGDSGGKNRVECFGNGEGEGGCVMRGGVGGGGVEYVVGHEGEDDCDRRCDCDGHDEDGSLYVENLLRNEPSP